MAKRKNNTLSRKTRNRPYRAVCWVSPKARQKKTISRWMSAVGRGPTADIHLPMLAWHPYRCSDRLSVWERTRLFSGSTQPCSLSSSVSASWEAGCGGDDDVSGRGASLPTGAIRHLLD